VASFRSPAAAGAAAGQAGRGPSGGSAGGPAGGGAQPDQAPAARPNLGAFGGNLPDDLAEQLSQMPQGLNFPPQPQGNIPAAFRGGGKRKKK